jgi:signal transduction histidine kinase
MVPLLRDQAADLGDRWTRQARPILMLDETDDEASQHPVDAKGLVEALIGGLAEGDDAVQDTIGQGMQFGSAAFDRGVSLHQVLKALDLLMAMALFAVESTLDRSAGLPETSAADGVRLSRRLQRRGALLSLAATRGYMQAYADALRDRFRHLRHDLRNPLGTIKSVLALMDDESVPLEARVNPNFRGMATRNARSLEELIAERLSDAAALLPTVAGQSVSVRAIACAVRRELRIEAESRNVAITVEQGGPHGLLDAAGLELLLRDAVHATLQECEAGEHIHIDFDQTSGRMSVVLSRESRRQPIPDARVLERLNALAGQIGATITAGEGLPVSIQLHPGELPQPPERERSVSREPGVLGDGETRQDIRGARESHHGQSGAH